MNRTNLLIQMAQLPATLEGTPSYVGAEMVRRMQIVSPSGTNFIYVGDVEPTSNVGPWLKDGGKWYVWDADIKRYVPQDLTDSATIWFHLGAAIPATSTPPVWLRTTLDYPLNPSYGDPLGWYVFNGTAWVPFNDIVMSGPTASRPAAPLAFQQYYDTDISVLLWYERSQWRTMQGNPGDVKQVNFDTLQEALTRNPGWQVLGNNNQTMRGRFLSQATRDTTLSGGTTDLSVDIGVSPREARESWGTTDRVSLDTHTHPPAAIVASTSPVSYPPTLSLWTLEKL
jgi:hypothetical protein